MKIRDYIFYIVFILWCLTNVSTYVIFGYEGVAYSNFIYIVLMVVLCVIDRAVKPFNRWLNK